jgi:hypothetical protein
MPATIQSSDNQLDLFGDTREFVKRAGFNYGLKSPVRFIWPTMMV